jgi:hypothetical protein
MFNVQCMTDHEMQVLRSGLMAIKRLNTFFFWVPVLEKTYQSKHHFQYKKLFDWTIMYHKYESCTQKFYNHRIHSNMI